MDRLVQRNVLAMSGRAVEASGDVDVLLLDKTGTITLGNRQAAEFIPVDGVEQRGARRGRAARVARRRDARGALDRRAREGAVRPARARARRARGDVHPVLGDDAHERRRPRRARSIRKGAADAVKRFVAEQGGSVPGRARRRASSTIARAGRHAARRRTGQLRARRHPPEGHRQGRHERALRRAAADGHPHGDDHRRQPASPPP